MESGARPGGASVDPSENRTGSAAGTVEPVRPVASEPKEQAPSAGAGLSGGQIAFIVAILSVGVALLGYTAYVLIVPSPPPPSVAAEAVKLLRTKKSTPLSVPLDKLLADRHLLVVDSEPHPLVGEKAPEFRLPDHEGKPVTLARLLQQGPVVVVFYYGYWCNHCVQQLFDLNEDIAFFQELGAQVVAISADRSEETAEKFRQYGAFRFPVLSDENNQIAKKYSVYQPATDREPEHLLHGTFVLDRSGVVRWAKRGDQPFAHNPTLLYHLAKIEERLPKADRGERQPPSTPKAPSAKP